MRFTATAVRQTFLIAALSLIAVSASAQITPLGDAYTNTAAPAAKYGANVLLGVDGASEITYIQFNLESIPSTASISQATLKLYVNSVTTSGSFDVDYVNGTWSESTIDASNAPALGANIASNVNVTASDKNQYILVNVTPAVQAWLSGSEPNNGLALVANGSFHATFDSKENATTSHPPELDIAFAGGDGTITGVTTGSGSGLSGGGTSGALNLSLTNTCATNQVLEWNGSAWACSTAGTGTITGVTAGTGLTGGGTSGSLTLNVNTATLNSTYAQLTAANTFTGSQTVNGNLSATGMVSGSGFQIGSNLFDYGSSISGNAFLGFGGNATTTGLDNTAAGAGAFAENTTGNLGSAFGYQALTSNTTGSLNTAAGYHALYSNTTGNNNTAMGYSSLTGNGTGSNNTAVGYVSGVTTNATLITGSNNTFLGANTNVGIQNALSNATAIGAEAQVTASNSLVLGSINGVNGAASSVNVGIGTTAPAYTLDVHGTGNFTGLVNFASGQTFPLSNGSVTDSMLANSAVTVAAGTGLTGGGSVSLGGTTTFNVDTTKIPLLAASNTFTGNQTVNGNLSTTSLTSGAISGTTLFVGGNKTPTTTTQGAYIAWNALTGGTGETDFINNQGLGGGGFAFMNTPNSGSPRSTLMFINGGGRVGINTLSPYSVLEADANAPAALGPVFTLTNNGSGQGAASAVDFNSYTPYTGTYNPTARIAAIDQGNASNDIVFSTNQPGAPNNGLQEHFRIKSTGGVSINSDLPMSHNPRMVFSGYFPNSLCGDLSCGNLIGGNGGWNIGGAGFFVPDQNILVTRIDAFIGNETDPSCGHLAGVVVASSAGGSSVIDFPDATQIVDSGPLSVPFSAGAQIIIAMIGAGSCNVGSSAGSDVFINVEYVMQ